MRVYMNRPHVLVIALENRPRLHAVAEHIRLGATSAGAQVRCVGDADARQETVLALLDWADGVTFGVEGHNGTLAPGSKNFLEHTASLWQARRLGSLLVSAFSADPSVESASARSAVYRTAYHWGSLVSADTPPPGHDPRVGRAHGARLARLAGRLAMARHRPAIVAPAGDQGLRSPARTP